MLKLGEKQTLKIVKTTDFGVYLKEEGEPSEEVLLPKKQVPEGAGPGTELEVFLYRDSKDRLIATVNEPLITLHHTAELMVREVTQIGAFLDMGLERDLLLPYREQTYAPFAGERVLAAMYVDKSGRLAATMKVYPYLSTDSPYQKDDEVEGLVYEVSRNFGAFVAVDMKYSGLIPKRECPAGIKSGDRVHCRVTKVREDGKMDLDLRKKAYLQLDEDGEKLLSVLKESGGFLPLHDKSDPEEIREQLGISKNAFKRAAGHLMKKGILKITETGISLEEDRDLKEGASGRRGN